jgi:hypothetical protein
VAIFEVVTEDISLILAIIGYMIILIVFKKYRNLFHLFIAYTFLFAGVVLTVAENYFFPEIFNMFEHLFITLASLTFGYTTFLSYKKIVLVQQRLREKARGMRK